MSTVKDDDETSIRSISRQEILTGLIWVILALIPIGAIATLAIVFTNPDLVNTITTTDSVDVGKFVDKVIESYDAFLLFLGVSLGTAGTVSAVKLGKSLAKD